jgi:hypothetical protein
MPRAADAKKITDIASIGLAFKRKAVNVSLNLDTATYEVKNAKGEILKTLPVAKGYDAAYIINRSASARDVEVAATHCKTLQAALVKAALSAETALADTQDEMMKAALAWTAAEPGSSRSAAALEVGRLQHAMAVQERHLRYTQYKYRGVLGVVPAPRRLYEPLSFDDRGLPFPVYKLVQGQTQLADRVIPVKSMETV